MRPSRRIRSIGLAATLLSGGWGLSASGQSTPEAAVKDVAADRPVLELVFVVDTTGSMGGLIEGAKQKVWGIVNDVLKAKSHPDVRVGLVAYRDRGDEYVSKVTPITRDLDAVYSALMEFRAGGGGDAPEDVRRGLLDGVEKVGWAPKSPRVAQILFLVGDAPPHDDYQDVPSTLETAASAVSKGIIVNAIQCGGMAETTPAWRAIAARGEGQYFAIAQDGGVAAIATPMDKPLADLGAKLGGTYTAFGGGAGEGGRKARAEMSGRQKLAEAKVAAAAPAPAAADRALNKLINRDAYVGDLLQSIEVGATKLDAVAADDLPDDLKAMTPEARRAEVDRRLAERSAIRAQILDLSKSREAFLDDARKKAAKPSTGFDAAVSDAIRNQAARRGLTW